MSILGNVWSISLEVRYNWAYFGCAVTPYNTLLFFISSVSLAYFNYHELSEYPLSQEITKYQWQFNVLKLIDFFLNFHWNGHTWHLSWHLMNSLSTSIWNIDSEFIIAVYIWEQIVVMSVLILKTTYWLAPWSKEEQKKCDADEFRDPKVCPFGH